MAGRIPTIEYLSRVRQLLVAARQDGRLGLNQLVRTTFIPQAPADIRTEALQLGNLIMEGLRNQTLDPMQVADVALVEIDSLMATIQHQTQELAQKGQELAEALGCNQQWVAEGSRLNSAIQRQGDCAEQVTSFGGETKDQPLVGEHYALHNSVGGRTHNEDSAAYFLLPDGREVYIVADGMGGHANGDVASRLFIQHLIVALRASEPLYEAIIYANFHTAVNLPRGSDGGTAFVLAIVDRQNNRLQIAHVADARCKIIQGDGTTYHLTYDHSLQFLLASVLLQTQGKTLAHQPPLTEADIELLDDTPTNGGNGIVSSCGATRIEKNAVLPPNAIRITEIGLAPAPVGAKAQLLLYSDGAVDGTKENQLTAIARTSANPTATVNGILQQAKLGNTHDNVTLFAVDLGDRQLDFSQVTTNNYVFDSKNPVNTYSVGTPPELGQSFNPLYGALQQQEQWIVHCLMQQITSLGDGRDQTVAQLAPELDSFFAEQTRSITAIQPLPLAEQLQLLTKPLHPEVAERLRLSLTTDRASIERIYALLDSEEATLDVRKGAYLALRRVIHSLLPISRDNKTALKIFHKHGFLREMAADPTENNGYRVQAREAISELNRGWFG